MIEIALKISSVEAAAKLFNTMLILEQNQNAAASEMPTPAPTVDVKEEAPKSRRAGRNKPKEEAPEEAPPSPAKPEPAPEAAKGEMSRDDALACLKTIAEKRKIGGKDLIAFLQKEFGVPKFSEISADRYVDLKKMAAEPETDPMA